MKIRTGFVSNSSSSSFVAVGIGSAGWNAKPEDNKKFHRLLDKMNVPKGEWDWEDREQNPNIQDYDYGVYKTKDTGLCLYGGYEIFFVGLDAMPFFKDDFKPSEIKQHLQKILKKEYDLDVDLDDLELRSGKTSSE